LNNLHISLTEFRNESRIIKEATSLIDNKIFDTVFIASLHAEGLRKEEKIHSNVIVNRLALKSRVLGNNLLIQLIKYFEFSYMLFFCYFKKNISVINIHSLGLLPLGYILKKIFKAKLVYDAHELETERNGLLGTRKKLAKLVEKILIYKVDKTIVVSESIADWYASAYCIERPTVVMNAPKLQNIPKSQYFRQELGINTDTKIFLYQGALTEGRGINLILKAFSELQDEDVAVVFMGYGVLENKVIDTSQQFNNIYFYPAVIPSIVLNYTSSADVGISIIEKTCMSYDYCMPNKLFEYAMVGIPVIASNMKDMASFVVKNNIGSVIEKLSVPVLKSAIIDMTKEDFVQYRDNLRQASEKYSWENQETNMLELYKKLLKV